MAVRLIMSLRFGIAWGIKMDRKIKGWLILIVSVMMSIMWSHVNAGLSFDLVYLDSELFLSYTGGITIIASLSGIAFLKVKYNAVAAIYFIAAWVNSLTAFDIELLYMISDAWFGIMTYMSIVALIGEGNGKVLLH